MQKTDSSLHSPRLLRCFTFRSTTIPVTRLLGDLDPLAMGMCTVWQMGFKILQMMKTTAMLLYRELAEVVECPCPAKEQTVAAVEATRTSGPKIPITKRSAKSPLIPTLVVAPAEVLVLVVQITVRRRRLVFRRLRRLGIAGNPWVVTILVALAEPRSARYRPRYYPPGIDEGVNSEFPQSPQSHSTTLPGR